LANPEKMSFINNFDPDTASESDIATYQQYMEEIKGVAS
jgi:hypothetical protein